MKMWVEHGRRQENFRDPPINLLGKISQGKVPGGKKIKGRGSPSWYG